MFLLVISFKGREPHLTRRISRWSGALPMLNQHVDRVIYSRVIGPTDRDCDFFRLQRENHGFLWCYKNGGTSIPCAVARVCLAIDPYRLFLTWFQNVQINHDPCQMMCMLMSVFSNSSSSIICFICTWKIPLFFCKNLLV